MREVSPVQLIHACLAADLSLEFRRDRIRVYKDDGESVSALIVAGQSPEECSLRMAYKLRSHQWVTSDAFEVSTKRPSE